MHACARASGAAIRPPASSRTRAETDLNRDIVASSQMKVWFPGRESREPATRPRLHRAALRTAQNRGLDVRRAGERMELVLEQGRRLHEPLLFGMPGAARNPSGGVCQRGTDARPDIGVSGLAWTEGRAPGDANPRSGAPRCKIRAQMRGSLG